MAILSLEELYEKHIKPLPPGERLRLLEMTVRDLAQIPVLQPPDPKKKSIRLAQLIGAARGSFSTPADVDQFIRQERDAVGILNSVTGPFVYLDANIFIYALEAHPLYVNELTALFEAINRGNY